MIFVTKLDGKPALLDLEAVKYMESTPDTLIFFINGDSMIVRESLEEVRERVIEYKAEVLRHSQHSSTSADNPST